MTGDRIKLYLFIFSTSTFLWNSPFLPIFQMYHFYVKIFLFVSFLCIKNCRIFLSIIDTFFFFFCILVLIFPASNKDFNSGIMLGVSLACFLNHWKPSAHLTLYKQPLKHLSSTSGHINSNFFLIEKATQVHMYGL